MGPKPKTNEVGKETKKEDVNVVYFEIKDEAHQLLFKIMVNSSCRIDIMMDYAKRQFFQKITEHIESLNAAVTDENKTHVEAAIAKAKEIQGSIQGTPVANFILRDVHGAVVLIPQEVSCYVEYLVIDNSLLLMVIHIYNR
jgi:hypothetical protein